MKVTSPKKMYENNYIVQFVDLFGIDSSVNSHINKRENAFLNFDAVSQKYYLTKSTG